MIMSKLKSALKHYPRLYNFGKNLYYAFRYNLKENLLGTRVRKSEWSTKHISEGNEWIMRYWDMRSHAHRSFLIEKLSKLSPFSSMLEVGCNCGPNLYLLAKKYPKVALRGIDINPLAVKNGNEWLQQEGLSNVKLYVGEARNLNRFKDKSFDIVFTDAILIYVGRDEIKETIKELIRVARHYIVLVEWHYFDDKNRDPYGLGVHQFSLWKRNYKALFGQFVPEENIRITKIPQSLWPDEGWKDYGAVIEVKLG